MLDFLKVFVRGIVCTLLLPFILVFLALYTVYLIVVYAILLVRNLIVFFMGGNATLMKQDIQAKKVLMAQNNASANMTDMLAGLMHSAIEQNPEAVRAMAQQQIAAQQSQQTQPVPPINEIPEQVDTKPVEDATND